jgi:hypothetical protein
MISTIKPSWLIAMILSITLLLPLSVSAEHAEFPIDSIMQTIEETVLDQDAATLTGYFASDVQANFGPLLEEVLSAETTIKEYDVYGYSIENIGEHTWRIDAKYSIDALGNNGNWNASGLNVYFIFKQIGSDENLEIIDSNIVDSLTPFSFDDIASFLYQPVFLVTVLISLVLFIFWVWMLIDAIKYQKDDRTMWLLIIIVGQTLGAIVYYFVQKRKRIK